MALHMAPEGLSDLSKLRCPDCRKESVHRVPCVTLGEQVKRLLFVSPFRCEACGHRFLAFRMGRRYPPVTDRRTHERVPVSLALAFSGGRITGEGTLVNISLGGCLIETSTPVKVDDIFHMKLFVSDKEPAIEVAGMVRSIGAKGIGMKFVRSAREDRRLIAYLRSQGID